MTIVTNAQLPPRSDDSSAAPLYQKAVADWEPHAGDIENRGSRKLSELSASGSSSCHAGTHSKPW